MKMWFPIFDSDPGRRLALGVFISEDEVAPEPHTYCGRLECRIQDPADRESPERLRVLIDDYLPGLMAGPEDLAAVIMESDTSAVILALEVVSELEENVTQLPEQERKELEQEAMQMDLENLLASVT